ncbi:uncharacterized protein [Callorhinus ursinus]|uniref:uncharacterized protein n=1 Tax=Callorhinus ursinus TaxID=34884 RepID=UPI003CD001F5
MTDESGPPRGLQVPAARAGLSLFLGAPQVCPTEQGSSRTTYWDLSQGRVWGQFDTPWMHRALLFSPGRGRDRERAAAARALPTRAPPAARSRTAGPQWVGARPEAAPPAAPRVRAACAFGKLRCPPSAPRRPAGLCWQRPESRVPGGGRAACRVWRGGAVSPTGEEYRRGDHHLVREGLSAEACPLPQVRSTEEETIMLSWSGSQQSLSSL